MSVNSYVRPEMPGPVGESVGSAVNSHTMSVGQVYDMSSYRKTQFVFKLVGPVHIARDCTDLVIPLLSQNHFQVALNISGMDQHIDRSFLSDRLAHEIMMPVRVTYDQYLHLISVSFNSSVRGAFHSTKFCIVLQCKAM